MSIMYRFPKDPIENGKMLFRLGSHCKKRILERFGEASSLSYPPSGQVYTMRIQREKKFCWVVPVIVNCNQVAYFVGTWLASPDSGYSNMFDINTILTEEQLMGPRHITHDKVNIQIGRVRS